MTGVQGQPAQGKPQAGARKNKKGEGKIRADQRKTGGARDRRRKGAGSEKRKLRMSAFQVLVPEMVAAQAGAERRRTG
jgi:hypothetical protein